MALAICTAGWPNAGSCFRPAAGYRTWRCCCGSALSGGAVRFAIACDRWRLAELKEKLEAVRFPLAELVERGQGFKDGGQDVRDFRKAVLGDHVRPSRSLLLRAAMAEARVTGDPSGNWKLAKHVQGGRRANARDDACAAGGSRCGGVSSRSQARKRQALHRRVCEGHGARERYGIILEHDEARISRNLSPDDSQALAAVRQRVRRAP